MCVGIRARQGYSSACNVTYLPLPEGEGTRQEDKETDMRAEDHAPMGMALSARCTSRGSRDRHAPRSVRDGVRQDSTTGAVRAVAGRPGLARHHVRLPRLGRLGPERTRCAASRPTCSTGRATSTKPRSTTPTGHCRTGRSTCSATAWALYWAANQHKVSGMLSVAAGSGYWREQRRSQARRPVTSGSCGAAGHAPVRLLPRGQAAGIALS